MRASIALAIAIALCIAAWARAYAAPQVQVSPVVIELSAEHAIASLRVRNTSEAMVAFDARAFAWTQEDGADVLAETGDIIVWPPAFVAPAGGEQIVRIALPAAAPAATERAYRLVLTQATLGEQAAAGMRVRLELSLPIFVAPQRADDRAPVLRWAGAGAARVLEATNPGNRRLTFQAEGLPRYLLAGATVRRAAPAMSALGVGYVSAAGVVRHVDWPERPGHAGAQP